MKAKRRTPAPSCRGHLAGSPYTTKGPPDRTPLEGPGSLERLLNRWTARTLVGLEGPVRLDAVPGPYDCTIPFLEVRVPGRLQLPNLRRCYYVLLEPLVVSVCLDSVLGTSSPDVACPHLDTSTLGTRHRPQIKNYPGAPLERSRGPGRVCIVLYLISVRPSRGQRKTERRHGPEKGCVRMCERRVLFAGSCRGAGDFIVFICEQAIPYSHFLDSTISTELV